MGLSTTMLKLVHIPVNLRRNEERFCVGGPAQRIYSVCIRRLGTRNGDEGSEKTFERHNRMASIVHQTAAPSKQPNPATPSLPCKSPRLPVCLWPFQFGARFGAFDWMVKSFLQCSQTYKSTTNSHPLLHTHPSTPKMPCSAHAPPSAPKCSSSTRTARSPPFA